MTHGAGELSNAQARQIALRAQGLGAPRPRGAPKPEHLQALISTLGAVQLDAVNVLVRSQYLTIYSRLGPYRPRLLDDLFYRRRTAFEYWGHAASILPVQLQPTLFWRMAAHAESKHWQAFRLRLERERPGYLAAVEREITERGPLAFGDLSDAGRRERVRTKYAASTLLWDRWSDGKTALEGLFDSGRLAAADRRGFERLYDLAERVIPPEVAVQPTPHQHEAQRELVRHAAGALGVAAVREIADYFRLPVAVTRARIRELVDSGDLLPARVQDWRDNAYVVPGANAAPVRARALLSPFDSLLWERDRAERLFGFRHSFELYVKAANRRYGYYVLPFLLGDSLVARVDLKADRRASTWPSWAPSSSRRRQPGRSPVSSPPSYEAWLELDAIEVSDRGDLAPLLRKARP